VTEHQNPADPALKQELVGLFQYIQRVRQEIAAIHKPVDDEHHFNKMGDQLDAIVKATEQATNTIMATIEKNEALLEKLKKSLGDKGDTSLVDEITTNNMDIIQACSFQDITGQRVTKVARSITYVEDRVNALIEAWGKAELEKVDVAPEQEKTEDEKLLNGPQLEGEGGLNQAEIDALFD